MSTMNISVEVKPGSKVEAVDQLSELAYRVRVRARPVDGKANDAVIAALAKHFGVARSRIQLLKGEKSRKKLFAIAT